MKKKNKGKLRKILSLFDEEKTLKGKNLICLTCSCVVVKPEEKTLHREETGKTSADECLLVGMNGLGLLV